MPSLAYPGLPHAGDRIQDGVGSSAFSSVETTSLVILLNFVAK